MERKPTTTIRVYPETKEKIEVAATANDRSIASMAKLLVDKGLEHLVALKQTAKELSTNVQKRIRVRSKERKD